MDLYILGTSSTNDTVPTIPHSSFVLDWDDNQYQSNNVEMNRMHINSYARRHPADIRRKALSYLHSLCDEISQVLGDTDLMTDICIHTANLLNEKSNLFGPESFGNTIKIATIDHLIATHGITLVRTFGLTTAVCEAVTHTTRLHGIKAHHSNVASYQIFCPRRSFVYFIAMLTKSFKLYIQIVVFCAFLGLRTRTEPPHHAATNANKGATLIGYTSGHDLSSHDVYTRNTYWGSIPQQLVNTGTSIHWILISTLPYNLNSAINLSNKCRNAYLTQGDSRSLLDQFASPIILLRTLCSFIRISVASITLCIKTSSLQSHIISSIHHHEIASSLYGPHLLKSIYHYFLLNRAVTRPLRSDLFLYLHEGLAWEKILARCFRYRIPTRPCKLVGLAHASIRFWDLRYFSNDHPTSNNQPHHRSKELPDVLLVTHPEYLTLLTDGNPLFTSIRLVEDVRLQASLISYYSSIKYLGQIYPLVNSNAPRRMLLIADYCHHRTEALVDLAASSIITSHVVYDIDLKLHPANTGFVPKAMPLKVSQVFHKAFIPFYDIILCSDTTSASLELSHLNQSVVVYSPPSSLGLPPLSSTGQYTIVESRDQFLTVILTNSRLSTANHRASRTSFPSDVNYPTPLLSSALHSLLRFSSSPSPFS